ncbi:MULTISPECIES: lipocalin family protein [unclassified Sphingobacterium]|uniref:lipocalin family protein n=1 Tax=unclassified Sphingobacterium TaxID=2609468 RepID=UPI0014388955|nr:lipocalin family protein [Sphingobacterium sp. B16(2022)]NJI72432.1 hypothetical protein [Sphingobacterium sp. B16(2022)]
MKIIPIIALLLFTVVNQGCSKQTENVNLNKIEGKWKLIAQNVGLPDSHVSIKDGAEIFINSDGTFKKFGGNCDQGTYKISENYIIFDYTCEGKENMLSKGIQKEIFSIKEGILRLTPTYLNCPEGCYFDYKKISDK